MSDRRIYRRESQDKRRSDLIDAALALIADGGLQAATVRAIAGRAGVTPGLIRYYFDSKDTLTRAAYEELMGKMTFDSAAVLADAPDDPISKLRAFVAASISPPVVDPVAVGLWAGFLHEVQRDAKFRESHLNGYLAFRDMLEGLIANIDGQDDPVMRREHTIGCNGVIDGLWLEGSVVPNSFGHGEIVRIGLRSVGAILGIDLLNHTHTTPPKESK